MGRETAGHRKEEAIRKSVVVYAGESHRRLSFLRYFFNDSQIISFPGGNEPDIEDVIHIMHGKLNNVFPRTQEYAAKDRIIFAADIRTSTLTDAEDHTFVSSKGKPKTPQQVRQIFHEAAQASLKHDVNPHYTVVSASGLLTVRNGRIGREVALHTTTVELNLADAIRLSLRNGFQDYMKAFENFYSNPPYSNNGSHPALSVCDLSAGLSLPVLAKIGAVRSIDGIQKDNSQFPEVFADAMYNVAVGFSPGLLNKEKNGVEERIREWPWLKDVCNVVLGS